MSDTKKVAVTCPACRKTGNFEIYEKISICDEPNLRDKIFSREIFKYKCPDCGKEIMVAYNCLYADTENKYIVYLMADNKADILQTSGLQIKDYSVRIVKNINSFIEKLALFEDGFDDHVIELYKLLLQEKFEEEKPKSELAAIYYSGRDFENERLGFYFISLNDENCETTMSIQSYKNLLEQFEGSAFNKKDEWQIDAEWATTAIQNGILD